MRVKNWERFQHFRDRRPPWIKLYRDLLDDPEWFRLDGNQTRLLVNLWMLASDDNTKKGVLPDIETIAFRLRVDIESISRVIPTLDHWIEGVDIKPISSGDQGDDSVISGRHQPDTPETETERETQEQEQPPSAVAPAAQGLAGDQVTDPQLELKRDLWRQTVEVCKLAGGKTDKQIRSVLGNLFKTYTLEQMQTWINAVIVAKPRDPLQYLLKIVSNQTSSPAQQMTAAEDQIAKWDREGKDEYGQTRMPEL